MTDTSNAGPSTPPPQSNPGASPAFPPMPKNAAGALGFVANYFGGRNPGALAGDAVILIVVATVFSFIHSAIPGNIPVLHPLIRMVASLCEGISLVCFGIAAARFLADAWRSRG